MPTAASDAGNLSEGGAAAQAAEQQSSPSMVLAAGSQQPPQSSRGRGSPEQWHEASIGSAEDDAWHDAADEPGRALSADCSCCQPCDLLSCLLYGLKLSAIKIPQQAAGSFSREGQWARCDIAEIWAGPICCLPGTDLDDTLSCASEASTVDLPQSRKQDILGIKDLDTEDSGSVHGQDWAGLTTAEAPGAQQRPQLHLSRTVALSDSPCLPHVPLLDTHIATLVKLREAMMATTLQLL